MGPFRQAALARSKPRRSSRARGAFAASVVVVSTLTTACHSAVRGNTSLRVKADSEQGPEAEAGPDFDKPIKAESLTGQGASMLEGSNAPLLGARRDMTLVTANATVACACVRIALGGAQSAAFQWQGSVPHLNDDTQLAFAMSSENTACNGEVKGSAGASYWGYRIAGNDVVIFLEGLRAGRPRAVAAIIPKPVGAGKVFVAPATRREPYGRSLDGKSERCLVGNAATTRSTPFTNGELGDSSLRNAQSAPSDGTGE